MYLKRVGSRAEVWHGTAHHTSGGLTKSDLFQDKYGRIRSKAASAAAKRTFNRKPTSEKAKWKAMQKKKKFV